MGTRPVMASRSISGSSSDDRPASTATHSAYLWVDDADALRRLGTGLEPRSTCPRTPTGTSTRVAHVDPDGNVLRFASPVGRSEADAS